MTSWRRLVPWVVGAALVASAGAGARLAGAATLAPELGPEGPGYGGDADRLHAERSGDRLVVVAFGLLAGSTAVVTAGAVEVVVVADEVGTVTATVEGVTESVVVRLRGTNPERQPIERTTTAW